jgi:hypothetical protein
LVFSVSKGSLKERATQEYCLFQRCGEHEPPSQRNDESGGGRTAKATGAPGALPYGSSDVVARNSVALWRKRHRALKIEHQGLSFPLWNSKCIQQVGFGLHDTGM